MKKALALFVMGVLVVVAGFALSEPVKFEDPLPPGGGTATPVSNFTGDSLAAGASDTSFMFSMFSAKAVVVHVIADTNSYSLGATIGTTTDSLDAFTVQYSWDKTNWLGDLGSGAADSACNCKLLGTLVGVEINTEVGGAMGFIVPVNTQLGITAPYGRAIAINITRDLEGVPADSLQARMDSLTIETYSIYQ